jgi:membrane protease YdiL (CAAX protease family)
MEAPGPETLSVGPGPLGWVRLALVFYVGMGLIAWLWRDLWLGESLLYASPAGAARGVHWIPDVAAGLAGAALAIGLSHLLTRRTRIGGRLAQALGAALGPLGLRQCLILAAASGVGEEALFRGALQPSLGLFAASLVFALVHFAPRRELWLWSVFAFAGGLGLGALFQATGNLVAPIVAHATLNAVNLRLLVRDYARERRLNPSPR